MIFWIAVLVFSSLAITGLVWPLLRGRAGEAPRSAVELAVYRDQLSEVRRDADRGLLDDQELEAASNEIARRILALETGEGEPPARQSPSGGRERGVAAALVLLVPAAALGLYLTLGSPAAPDYPLAGRKPASAAVAQHDVGSMDAMVNRLEAKLRDDPANLDGWVLIARSYATLGRHRDAALAYQKAAALSGGQAQLVGNMAESLVKDSGGQVTSEARKLFTEINRTAPDDARARYYLALAEAQAGDSEEAVRLWLALEADSAADAPWLPVLRQRIEETAQASGLDLAVMAPSRPRPTQAPGPDAEDVAAAQAMSGDERLMMVRGMVGQLSSRLEEDPSDLEGWLRLVRSYAVLGETNKAREALQRSASIATDLQSPLIRQIREAAAQLGIKLNEGQQGTIEPAAGGD